MRRLLVILSGLVLLTACERDDLCLEKPAADMNTLFINHITQEREAVELMVLYGQDTVVQQRATDSLHIPLPVDTSRVTYRFIKNPGNNSNTDQVEISYTIDEIFISKACGFKTVFTGLQMHLINDSDNWIKQIEIVLPEIKTDTLNHVKIYH